MTTKFDIFNRKLTRNVIYAAVRGFGGPYLVGDGRPCPVKGDAILRLDALALRDAENIGSNHFEFPEGYKFPPEFEEILKGDTV